MRKVFRSGIVVKTGQWEERGALRHELSPADAAGEGAAAGHKRMVPPASWNNSFELTEDHRARASRWLLPSCSTERCN